MPKTFRPSWLPTKAQRRKQYDILQRDKGKADFYRSTEWRKIRKLKINLNPVCETPDCHQWAKIVHHIVEIADDPDLALDLDNLMSSCAKCHNRIHAAKRRKKDNA